MTKPGPMRSVVALAFGFCLSAPGLLTGCHQSSSRLLGDAGADATTDAVAPDGPRVGRPPPDASPGFDAFIDPGCDAGERPAGGEFDAECDVFAQDCPIEGQACYSWAVPPSDPCDEERFVTRCVPAGSGEQGDSCAEAANRCAPGYACVVTGAGVECARVCNETGGEPGCPRGFVCRPTDVPGHGVCL